ncbi:MAG: helix-turn-helix domain-containing protein [Prevotellaceae bacterium]|nr:helix-turn-helix domain-containing protein [Prevotellaceae bacterium]
MLKKVQVIKYGDIVLVEIEPPQREEVEVASVKEKYKPVKGDSAKRTLEMFNAGQTMAQIAQTRNISTSTVETHFVQLIASGDLDIHKWLSDEQICEIEATLKTAEQKTLTQIVAMLNQKYSYGEIRGVQAHQQFKRQQQ